jgi:DNA-binding transcriptional regulator YiaG
VGVSVSPQAIRRLRERLGETQAAFALRFGYKEPYGARTISRWETGATKPPKPVTMLLKMLADQSRKT